MTITQQQAREALERVYYATHASFIDRNLVRQYIEQSTAQPQAVVPADQRPVNCGTGYCSCIECVVEPTAQAERAPVVQAVQAREYPPLPWGNQQPYVWFCRTKDTDLVAAFRAYVDADRASTVAALKARVAELEKDAARLEFVCNSPNRMVERESGLWRVYEDVAPADHPTSVWQGITPRWHVTPREAIDAAITAALTKGQP